MFWWWSEQGLECRAWSRWVRVLTASVLAQANPLRCSQRPSPSQDHLTLLGCPTRATSISLLGWWESISPFPQGEEPPCLPSP